MTNKNDWSDELAQLAEKLRDPFKMRMTVAGVMVAFMCFAINDPIHGRMKRSNRELNQLKTTVRTAEEVILLREKFAEVEDRILRGTSNDVVVSHLIDIVRSQGVELMRIDAQAPERLGPMQSVSVTMDVNGSFDALTALLHQLDSDQYLMRVDTVAITPPERDRTVPTMNVTIQIMKDAA